MMRKKTGNNTFQQQQFTLEKTRFRVYNGENL